MKVVASNPCDALERPRVVQGSPRGLTADQIRRLLEVIPSTPVGLRDRAIILTLVLTGRRRAEVLGLKVGDISQEGSPFYSYRGKGGKTGKRELPRPALEAIEAWLASTGRSLATMEPRRLALAGHANRARHHERDLLHQPSPLPEEGRASSRRRAHLPTQRRQAAARRRRVDRGGVAVPGPQQPGGDDDLPASTGGAGGQELGGSRRSYRPLTDSSFDSNVDARRRLLAHDRGRGALISSREWTPVDASNQTPTDF